MAATVESSLKYLLLKSLPVLAIVLFSGLCARAQCFRIESILVDACDGSNEGKNEMVTFRIGNVPLNTANLTVAWPNNSWLGLCQNTGTASDIASVNATITKCGFLKEPLGGMLPANSKVLLVTSTAWNPMAQSFANLSDTLYVIFQCAGNTAGHFKNYGTTPPLTRTLNMSFSTPASCTATATYSINMLTMQNGSLGAQDGGSVQYDPAGNASYVNYGCAVPVLPLFVDAGASQSICYNGQAILSATTSDTYNSLNWSGGNGTFSSPTAPTTTYTPGAGETGPVKLYCTISRLCATYTPPEKDSAPPNIISIPAMTISPSPLTLCNGQAGTLTVQGSATSYTWSTSASADTISVSAAGVYTVSGSNQCGISSATVAVDAEQTPTLSITATSTIVCPNEGTILTVNGGSMPYYWSHSSIIGNTVGAGYGTYSVVCASACGTASASIVIAQHTVSASFSATPVSGPSPLNVSFTNNSVNAVNYSWFFGNGHSSTSTNPGPQAYTGPGTYTIVLVASNGNCQAYDTLTVTVLAEMPYLVVPNVFTPNGDHVNDLFKVSSSGIKIFQCTIYDRWGIEMFSWNDPASGWDGTKGGNSATDGTYFYVIEGKDLSDKTFSQRGAFVLTR